MRRIWQIDDPEKARMFSDVLFLKGIANQADSDDSGHTQVWIHDDDRLADAKTMLEEFLLNPDDPQYAGAVSAAEERRRSQQKTDAEYRNKVFGRKKVFSRLRVPPVTLALIGISILVTTACGFTGNRQIIDFFSITRITEANAGLPGRDLPEIASGQAWRLVTPIFWHMDILHIIFNMLWLRDLGTILEKRHGPFRFLFFVVVLAAVSNYAQFIVSGPAFGGMSGVVYGLLGYIWMRGRIDPFYELRLNRNTVIMMGIWLVVGMLGILHIANTAHISGLLTGILIGFAAGKIGKQNRFTK